MQWLAHASHEEQAMGVQNSIAVEDSFYPILKEFFHCTQKELKRSLAAVDRARVAENVILAGQLLRRIKQRYTKVAFRRKLDAVIDEYLRMRRLGRF
jgi:hypothetical protein